MRKLTVTEMQEVCGGGRYGDSTEDYVWQEMSTGDYEWYVGNFMADVQSAVDNAVRDAGPTTPQEAQQIANAYLASVGLAGLVHTNPPPGEEGDIVVTGTRYDRPNFSFGAFDPLLAVSASLSTSFIYDLGEALDAENATIEFDSSLDPNSLTPQQLAAIDTLRTSFNAWVEHLKTIPPGTVFHINGIGDVTAGELVSSLSLADFVILPSNANLGNAPVGVDPSAYAGGGTYWNNGNPIFAVRVDQLVNYMSSPTMVAWYFTHELAHATAAGFAYTSSMRTTGSELGAQLSVDEGQRLEQYADALGRAIGTAAGFDWGTFGGFFPGGPTVTTSGGSTGGTGGGGTGGGGTGGGGGWENNNPIP